MAVASSRVGIAPGRIVTSQPAISAIRALAMDFGSLTGAGSEPLN